MLLSIIIPVYNVEAYLERCISSITNQSFNDYEIILVNDGSTDNSLSVCESFCVDDRIKLCSKPNGGLSSARNYGIERAEGDYLFFVDSDDYIEPECLLGISELIYKFRSDIFVIKASKVTDDGRKIHIHPQMPEKEYTADSYLEYLSSVHFYTACAPYLIYKRDFISENKFRFYDQILHEDELWTPEILLKAHTVYSTNIDVYCHYMRDGSIMRSENYRRRGESLLIVLDRLLCNPEFIDNPHAAVLRNQWAFLFLEAVVFLNNSKELKIISSKQRLLNFSYTKYLKIKSILYCISPTLYIIIRNVIKRKG